MPQHSPNRLVTPFNKDVFHACRKDTDIYSYGATFYHALVGTPPFDANSVGGFGHKHIYETLVPPIKRNPNISRSLNALIEKCLAKSPADRFQSFEEILKALKKIPIVEQRTTASPARKNKSRNSLPVKSKRSIPKTPLWIYKCNPKSGAGGNWIEDCFESPDTKIKWGNVHSNLKKSSIQNHASRKIVLEQMQIGDLILAWQSDQKLAIGLCRVSDLEDNGNDTVIVLERVYKGCCLKDLRAMR